MILVIFEVKNDRERSRSHCQEGTSVRYPASETAEKHERILNEAAKLFRERGFAGVGVAEIMQAAGLTHGAFYAHFKSKDDLAAEALVRAFSQSGDQAYAATGNAAEAKKVFLERYLSAKHRDRPGAGCAIAALGAEIARDTVVRAPFTEQVKRMIAGMAKGFGWKSKAPARQNAIHLLAAVVGALILARAVDDPKLSDEILASVRDRLGST
jgi:TetR/AcrR family transcriptional regulator, transcriptional repressor for nem operon